jgi:hypothetical protein
MKRLILFCLLMCIAPVAALAQGACPTIVETALAAADQLCQTIGRNQACYGNIDITAEAQPDATDFRFTTQGDVADVSDILTLRLSPMNETTGAWGVAVMRLQANLPDTLPGENVTFVLFGDVEIQNAVDPNDPKQKPMQAFTLRTGVADSACEEAPESGLLVQTPEGIETVAFNVNGVDVSMGSTVLFQGNAELGLTVSTLEGSAFVAAEDNVQPIVPGSWVRIGIGQNLRANASPELPESYARRARILQALPIRLLQRQITIAPPLTPEQLVLVRERIQDGRLPCDIEGLPACGNLRQFVITRAQACLALPRNQRPPFCTRLRNFVERIADEGIIEMPTVLTPQPLPLPGANETPVPSVGNVTGGLGTLTAPLETTVPQGGG